MSLQKGVRSASFPIAPPCHVIHAKCSPEQSMPFHAHIRATLGVPPSPTLRASRSVATPMGASNLDAIIDEGTLTIGWVGPALLGILIAAFGWAGRVFEWLGTLATWLFSGEWRGGGRRDSEAGGGRWGGVGQMVATLTVQISGAPNAY